MNFNKKFFTTTIGGGCLLFLTALSSPTVGAMSHMQNDRSSNSYHPIFNSGNNTSKNPDLVVNTLHSDSLIQGDWGTCHWTFDPSTGILSIGSGEMKHNYAAPYIDGQIDACKIKKICITGPIVAPSDSSYLFSSPTSSSRLNRLETITGLNNLDTSQVHDMSAMFSGCNNVQTLDVSNFETSNVKDMAYMFSDCNKIQTLNVSNFITSNVKDMAYMFLNCNKIQTLDVSNFITSKLEAMPGMFLNCQSISHLDLSHFDTSNTTEMDYLLRGMPKLKSLNLGKQFFIKTFGKSGHYILDDIVESSEYTGKWINVGTGTVSSPKGKNIWTSKEFVRKFNAQMDADTYVWQKNQTQN